MLLHSMTDFLFSLSPSTNIFVLETVFFSFSASPASSELNVFLFIYSHNHHLASRFASLFHHHHVLSSLQKYFQINLLLLLNLKTHPTKIQNIVDHNNRHKLKRKKKHTHNIFCRLKNSNWRKIRKLYSNSYTFLPT